MFLLLAASLAACSAKVAPTANVGAEGEPVVAAAEKSLAGSWRIVTIDGKPPVETAYGKPATLVFDARGHGGNAGCNDFGGYGLQHEGRWYGGGSMANQMACGSPRDEQDAAVFRLLGSGPRLEWSGADRVTLAAAERRMVLERTGPARSDPAIEPPRPLLGSRWRLRAVDGAFLKLADWREAPQLLVEGERYRFDHPCLTAEGTWRQLAQGEARLEPPKVTARRACPTGTSPSAEAMLTAIAGTRRYVTGPNGEILLAGGGHWIEGEGVRIGAGEPNLMVGRWQREGASPTERPAELILAERSFSRFDGCNRTEGLAILFERQLISLGSGLSTLVNCAPDQVDKQFVAVVGSRPRIGLLANGSILLSSPAGELRLKKVGAVDARSGGVGRALTSPQRFELVAAGGGTLEIIGPSRYRLSLKCGAIEGSYRQSARDPEGSHRFGPDREPESCFTDPQSRPLADLFRGNVEVAIGPNRDIALFVSRFGSSAARMSLRAP